MNNQRRLFLSRLTFLAGVAALNKPLNSVAAVAKRINTLHKAKSAIIVYHTNDLHGHIDAVYDKFGGLSQIETLLKNEEIKGLLLDAGGFMNCANSIMRQKQVIARMNAIGYHAAAIGGEELSNGQEYLAALVPLMNFNLLNCNLQFDGKLAKLVKPYLIINSGNFRVGITGVCHPVNGINYNDAIESANRMARFLKADEKCDFVICLSHLGYEQEGDKADNQKLAMQSENIDMIIGGKNNKLLNNSMVLRNKMEHEVILAQTGWDGIMMGRTIINFDKTKQKNGIRTKHFIPGMRDNQSYAASFSALQLATDTQI
ncbi:MAG: hypothetical protein ACHQIM_05855 [Sphingobacteriales bacterium]